MTARTGRADPAEELRSMHPDPEPRGAPEPDAPAVETLVAGQPLFEGVAPSELGPLLTACEVRLLDRDAVLIEPGQLNHNLYLVLDGQLRVELGSGDARDGFGIPPGECVGEISIVDGRPATARVAADRPTRVLVIPEADLWRDFLRHPRIAKNFMRMFAERFRSRNAAIQRALEERLRFEHLKQELACAREIQAGLLPRGVDLSPAFDVVTEMMPAREIGGDFYDVFPIGNDEYCIAIGDIAGKGVPAALFMVRTTTLLRTELRRAQPLELAMARLNRRLCEENPTCMFATLIAGVLNVAQRRYRFVSAGHNPIVHGHPARSYSMVDMPEGVPVGIDPNAGYEAAQIDLASGDVMLLYTDGVTEAMNREREQFQAARLLACLQAAGAATARTITESIKHEVLAFAGGAPQSDDLTTVVLRCTRGARE